MSEWRIPLADLRYGTEEKSAVMRVLESGWLSMGPEVAAFEAEFARALAVKYAVAVSSGTAALHLALLALDIGPGDEVVQPAINFVAAANMTVAVGATPVFADIIDLDEPTVDPSALERLITPRTKAVVAMHYGGYLCRMADIMAIARQRGIAVIEDACHAVGARDDGSARMAGAVGDIAAFSFFSNKNLSIGEGGMVTTDRDDLAEAVRRLRSHGMTTLTWDRHRGHASGYDVTASGFNYRLDEIRAALGRVQLERLGEGNAQRRQAVAAYRERLAPWTGGVVPFARYRGDSAHHLMVVVLPDAAARTQRAQRLREAGIQTSLHYPCIPAFDAFRRFDTGPLERSRTFAAGVLTLPLFPHLSPAEVDEVCVHLGAE